MCLYSKIVPTLTNISPISNSVLTVIYTFDANEGALDLNKKSLSKIQLLYLCLEIKQAKFI